MNKMDIMDQRNSFQESMKRKLVTFPKIEETILLKPKLDMELEMHGDNMVMKNSEIPEVTHSRRQRESLKTKHFKVQESTSIE